MKKFQVLAGFLPLSDQYDEHKAVVKPKGKCTPGAETRKAKFQEEYDAAVEKCNERRRRREER